MTSIQYIKSNKINQKTKRITFLISLTITRNSFAKLAKKDLPKPGSITGKVIIKTTNKALPCAYIVIRAFAKKIITGAIWVLMIP